MSDYVCVYQITFADGGEPEYGILSKGSREDCERVMSMIPAIAYNGPRPVDSCSVAVVAERATEEGT
jgi:hypothetical protein